MSDPSTLPKRLIGWGRDILIFAAIVWVINWWQTKDMLSDAGDISIPSMQLARLDGSGVTAISPYTGKPTLVYFFAPWCSVCRLSINNLDYVDQAETNVYLIALDYDDANEVQTFVDEVGLKLPVHMGHERLKQLFQIQAYPSYFVLDNNFTLVDRTLGYSTALGLKARTL